MTLSMTLEGIQAFLAQGGTVEQVVIEAYDRITRYGDKAVWIALRPREEVLAEARVLDASPAAEKPLYGVPFAVKDNIDVAGLPCSAACPAFTYEPDRDATVVARLRTAGAIVLGKTNLDQFATGLVGTRSPFGAPRCVFDQDYISGGSSSGSAVAVAAGLVAFSLGTDTAGSGRVPAAFNNLVGVKPTKGLLSTSGVVPACRSLDCVTVFAASVAEGTLIRRIAEGHDAADPYSRPSQKRRLPHVGLRVGVPRQDQREFYGNTAYAALYQRALDEMISLDAELVEIDFAPFRDAAKLLYGGPWVAERLEAVGDHLSRAPDSFDPVVRSIVETAKTLSAVDAFRGQYELAALTQQANAQWARMDMLLLPTAPTIHKVEAVMVDPVRLNSQLGHYTNFVNLLDCAAIAVPAGFTETGLPFGVTLVGPAFSDDSLALIADRLHRRLEPGYGQDRASLPDPVLEETNPEQIALAVVGAHLSGQPLHWQLTERNATLVARTRTAPEYRLYALAETTPPKPGLVADPDFTGDGIEIEVWSMDAEAFGTFTALVPAPLAIGTLRLADGTSVKGFVCEPAGLVGAQDITRFGGWRAYLAQ
ncbi:Allophanate hydrolase [Granulibacter bethesdensis]|uniref:Allophanate hydrolase n=1 Tax=Granulibacter bethesdensis TaxID=364410 RepID=A0AAN0VGA0_9PROT|nr:allophanate hydrolase [Granulibacter bethesdensis]AHJ63643.1 Allophanate hydrolase [Granulibacter bethesdensis]